MADGSNLGDLLAGAAGAPVNRPALNAYVTQGQAMAGLRTAQTEDALTRAQQLREEMDAGDQLEGALTAAGMQPSAARSAALMLKGHFGNSQQALEAVKLMQEVGFWGTLGDPTKLGTPAATAAQQGVQGKIAEPVNVPNNFTVAPGMPQPTVSQTPEGAAETKLKTEQAGLAHAQATNPAAFHAGTLPGGQMPPELQKAVDEGRLDPTRINSRTVGPLSALAQGNPTLDFNKMHSDAALQANPTFQQRAITVEALPTVLSNMTALGKKLGYSDNRTVGRMQQWMNGEFNDPTYAEYMAVRNDALMSIANTMRGVGMSDQAHRAEIEAAAPTMSPMALDGWLKGQMSTLQPRLAEYERVRHRTNGPPGSPNATPVPGGPQGPAANDPLGILGQH